MRVQRSSDVNKWLLLIYRIPREPTAHRVSIWRKLKQLGAVLLHDSVWVLPATPQTREQFQWLASEIVEQGGQATLSLSEILGEAERAKLEKSFSAATDQAYQEILSQLQRKKPDLAALGRRYQQARAQDYFRSKLGEKVRKALVAKGESKS
jgi:DNA-binding transcriptional regulator PaaX